MTDRKALAELSVAELQGIARARALPGRSRMRKAELIDALASLPPGGAAPRADLATPHDVVFRTVDSRDQSGRGRKERRERLNARLAAYVDTGRRCVWRTAEGYPCGLPPVVDEHMCCLHGGIDIFDRAVPVCGRLGIDTWPTLARHLLLSTYDVDPIGLDPVIAEVVWHLTNFLYFDYFRVEVEGAEHLPADGAAIVVGNHGGAALPYDAFMLTAAVANEGAVPRRLRVTGTEIFNMLPFVSHLYRKAGGAYASRADTDYLLGQGRMVGVFPEGERGFMKPVWDSYEVQRFGRGGFLNLAETHRAPVIPVAIVGSEEVHPAVGVSETLARMVRLIWPEQRVEQIAVVLNPIPLPVRWRIRFLPAVQPEGPEALRDPLRMLERTEAVRTTIQEALKDMIERRGPVF